MRVNGAGSIHARASKSCSRKPHSTRKSLNATSPSIDVCAAPSPDGGARPRRTHSAPTRRMRASRGRYTQPSPPDGARPVARPNHHRQETAHEIGARVDQRAVDGQRARRAVADPHERIGVRAEIDDDLRIDQMHGLEAFDAFHEHRVDLAAHERRDLDPVLVRAARKRCGPGATFTFVGQVDPFGVAVPEALPARARSGSLSARPPARSRC